MGLDIYAGMLYGTYCDKVFDYSVRQIKIPVYDWKTGKLTDKTENQDIEEVTFLVNIFNWKAGETIKFEDFENRISDLEEEYQELGKEFYFIRSDSLRYFGFILNKNEPTYNCPQDWLDEYEENLEAVEEWNKVFPNIPANKYVYVRASY